MKNLPKEMLTRGRPPDQQFDGAEDLYRRFHPKLLDGEDLELDAIELPDMSVNRGKYGPPHWLLLDEKTEEWGVAAFQVGDIPGPLEHLGVWKYTFGVTHVPLRNNYPHSEVRAYEDGKHINAKKDFNPDLHLRWREQLLWKTRIAIRPRDGG